MTEENQLIELVTDEGNSINCEVFDLVEFEGKTTKFEVEVVKNTLSKIEIVSKELNNN